MAKKASGLKKVAGAAAKVASFAPGPVGMVAKVAGGLIGKTSGTSGKKKRFSIARLGKRLIQAKINAKIQKIRLSPYKGL